MAAPDFYISSVSIQGFRAVQKLELPSARRVCATVHISPSIEAAVNRLLADLQTSS